MAEIWKRREIESPCQQICVIDPQSGFCIGCGRTGQEISRWSLMSTAERREICQKLDARQQNIAKNRRGGRKARQKNANS